MKVRKFLVRVEEVLICALKFLLKIGFRCFELLLKSLDFSLRRNEVLHDRPGIEASLNHLYVPVDKLHFFGQLIALFT